MNRMAPKLATSGFTPVIASEGKQSPSVEHGDCYSLAMTGVDSGQFERNAL